MSVRPARLWVVAAAAAVALGVAYVAHAPFRDVLRSALGRDALAQSVEFTLTEMARVRGPWSMAFLPDGRALVTQQQGALQLVALDGSGASREVSGVPAVAFGGQGGLGDVVLHPQFAANGLVYLSFAERGDGGVSGAAVARAKLALDASGGGALENLEVIWRQTPKVGGSGHFGQRIAFAPNGDLYISSGERQQFDPAQDMAGNLGKIVRLRDDGSVPDGNPFARDSAGGVAAEIWSLGHRNPLGLAFDGGGRLWEVEMGPRGGDELNLIEPGANYGWPIVSNGNHYDFRDIPDHPTRPEFHPPAAFWNPVISPASMTFYDGSEFPQWRGNAFIGGLSSQSLVRVAIDGASAREAERFPMRTGIRQVRQGPDGAIWLLEDGRLGRIVRLTAPR